MITWEEIVEVVGHGAVGGALSFLWGAIWGSFFNVCILRIPADHSLTLDSSRCPQCLTPLKWYHNIPIVSYLALRARCAFCANPISIQYPLVELASGLMFLWLYARYGWDLRFLLYGVFLSLLLIITVIDLYHQIIPDELSLPGIVAGLAASFVLREIGWAESVMGILVGGGFFLVVALGYEWLAKREGLGGGDVKLLAMIGAWLGYQSVLPVVVISSSLGAALGIVLMISKGRDFKMAIPFGPFLAAGAFIYLFWGETINLWLYPRLG